MKIALSALVFGFFSLLYADYVLTYDMDYEILKFKYKDKSNSQLHISSPESKIALYTINDTSYRVEKKSSTLAKTTKVQAKPPKATIQNAGNARSSNYKIRKYKKQKLIAGIQGKKWMVYGREGGQVFSQIIYVTDDPRVLKAVRSMFLSISKANENPNQMLNIYEIEPGYIIIQAEGIRLKYFQDIALPISVYILPQSSNPQAFFQNN